MVKGIFIERSNSWLAFRSMKRRGMGSYVVYDGAWQEFLAHHSSTIVRYGEGSEGEMRRKV